MGNRVFVGNVPWDADEDALRSFFGEERVKSVRIMTDRETGRSRGFAFVDMVDDVMAEEVIRTHNGRELMGRELRVDQATERERRPPSGGGNGYGGGGSHGGGGRGRSKGRGRRRRDQEYDEY